MFKISFTAPVNVLEQKCGSYLIRPRTIKTPRESCGYTEAECKTAESWTFSKRTTAMGDSRGYRNATSTVPEDVLAVAYDARHEVVHRGRAGVAPRRPLPVVVGPTSPDRWRFKKRAKTTNDRPNFGCTESQPRANPGWN